jgi:hypothetical protein
MTKHRTRKSPTHAQLEQAIAQAEAEAHGEPMPAAPATAPETQPAPITTVDGLAVALGGPVVLVDAFGNEYTEADLAPKAPAPKTVVKTVYKHRYQDQARARGATDKVSKRGNGDWLQRELQAETVGKDGKLDLEAFKAILDCNGADYGRWKQEGHGWEGRFRMSGSLVLRGIVGKSGLFRTPTHTVNVQQLADEGNDDAAAFLAKWAN